MKRAVIFVNGEYNSYNYIKKIIQPDDYIICADGAIVHCLASGFVPDLWVGDFDSCDFENIVESHAQLSSTKFVKLNRRKDRTDTHVACDMACERGYDTIVILGAFGKRLDHMFANVSLLEYLYSRNVTAYLENEKNRISFLQNELIINKEKKYFSVVPLDSYIVVDTISGAEYPIKNEKLFRDESKGISNEVVGDSAFVKLSSGRALIIESDD